MRKLLFGIFLVVSVFTCNITSAFAVTHYFSAIRNSTGDAVSGATVTVYNAGTVVLSTIYSDQAGSIPKSNPFLSDANGNYDFYAASGLYKVTVSKVGVGTFTTDNILIGMLAHASTHKDGGSDELLLSDFDGTITSSQILDGTIVNSDINSSAAIAESKLALNNPTHSNVNDPTADQKAAMGGTSGLPSGTNKYVTNNDSRNTNARTPTTHAASHTAGGLDAITVTTGQLSGVNAGTNLTADLEEEAHATEHQDGGADEISVTGLSGALADAQKSEVLLNGASIGTRPKINLIEGTDIDLTVADNVGQNRVDVTVNSTASTSGPGAPLEIYEGITPIVTETSRLTFNVAQFDLTDTGSNRVNVDVGSLSGDVSGVLQANGITAFGGYTIEFPSPPNNFDGPVFVASTGKYTLGYMPSFTSGTVPELGQVPMYNNWPLGTDEWLPQWPITACVNSADCEVGRSISFSSLFTIDDTLPGNQINIGLDEDTLRDSVSIRGSVVNNSVPPTDGQTLIYDSGTGEWEYGTSAVDMSLSYTIPLVDHSDFPNINSIDFIDPLIVESSGGGLATVHLGPITSYQDNSISDLDINWGTEVEQVNADDIPNGSTNSLIPTMQLAELTSTNNTGLHYHASDRALANATGTLPANQVGNGLTDAQILNNISVSSSGNVDAAAINSGTLNTLRLGNQKYQTKSLLIPYPSSYINVPFGNILMPVSATITKIAGKIRETNIGGSCSFHVKIDNTNVLASPLAADADGEITNAMTNPTVSANNWMSFIITGCVLADDATELSITVVYLVN